MKITDMNIDCLESCLEHLNIEDLVNAASSNKQLNHAARYVFVKMYRHRVVNLKVVKFCIDNRIYFCEKKNELYIRDLRMGLQFLRCFGDLISEMVFISNTNDISTYLTLFVHVLTLRDIHYLIQYTKSSEWEHLIIEYINEYCSDSLTKIEFWYNPKGGLNKLTKKFNKVEKIRIENSYPTEKKLNELFPNMRELELYYDRDGGKCDYEFIACNFPYLEHLDIYETKLNDIQKKNLVIALRSNSQLKSLKANQWFNHILHTNYFQEANEILQNIETLNLSIHDEIDFNSTISEHKHLKNLKKLRIGVLEGILDDHQPFMFPFAGDQLESLTIRGEYRNLNLFNIIEKFSTVKKLKIDELDPMDCSKISKKLPLLEEIVLCDCSMTADEILSLINDIQSLRSLALKINSPEKVFEKDELGNGWSVSHEKLNQFWNDRIIPENEIPKEYTRYRLCSLKRQIQNTI